MFSWKSFHWRQSFSDMSMLQRVNRKWDLLSFHPGLHLFEYLVTLWNLYTCHRFLSSCCIFWEYLEDICKYFAPTCTWCKLQIFMNIWYRCLQIIANLIDIWEYLSATCEHALATSPSGVNTTLIRAPHPDRHRGKLIQTNQEFFDSSFIFTLSHSLFAIPSSRIQQCCKWERSVTIIYRSPFATQCATWQEKLTYFSQFHCTYSYMVVHVFL